MFRRSYCDTSKCALDAASDFLDVSFEHALAPHAVYVYETFNPGAVAQIWAGTMGWGSGLKEKWT